MMADGMARRMQGPSRMTDRIPDERAEGGAMTGATGSLTPDIAGEDFVPAETRELTDPHAAPAGPAPPPPSGGTVLGGDERRDPEDEHL
jgi:hypothetical protein